MELPECPDCLISRRVSMSNTFKVLIIVLFFTLLMPFGSTPSLAYGHGGGGYHGGGGDIMDMEAVVNFGLGFSYSPYYYGSGYYYPYYYPDYYDTGIIVSSPAVETPEIIVQPSTTVVATAPSYPTTEITPVQITATDTDNEITINIPNVAGGYTSVLMKRSGKGFVGPQGEYYPEFPRVSVLKVIYGK
jgi:hypothetical protein